MHALKNFIVGGGLLLLGSLISVTSAGHWYRAHASTDWPSVSGVIVPPERGKTGAIAYAYRVGGVKYTGDRIGFGAEGDYGNAAAVDAKYPTGKEVSVHYDSDDPAQSTLVAGSKGAWAKSSFLGGLATALVGMAFVLLGLHDRRDENRRQELWADPLD